MSRSLLTLWIRAGLAAGAVAMLPLVNLVTIDEIDRLHRQGPVALSSPLSTFAFDPMTMSTATSSRIAGTGVTMASSGGSGSGSHAKGEVPRSPGPIPSPPVQATTAQFLTVPVSYWLSQRMMLSFGGTVLLAGLAITAIIGLAREARRSARPNLAAVPSPNGADRDAELQRFAEQVRSDARDVVHAMRTPLSIVIGYTASLKRTLPAGDPRVAKALSAIELSTSSLGGSIDDAWDRANSLQSFAQAPREAVDLSEAIVSACSDCVSLPCATQWPTQRHVLVPRGWLQEAVQEIVEAFEEDAPDTDLTLSVHRDEGKIGFALQRNGTEGGHAVESICLKSWPQLVDADRAINLMGGNMAVTATTDARGLQMVRVELPVSRRPAAG